MSFIIPDREEVASTEVKRGIFRYLKDQLAEDAEVTVTLPKVELYKIATINEKPDISAISIDGDMEKWNLFLFLQEPLNHNFNIMTPVPK